MSAIINDQRLNRLIESGNPSPGAPADIVKDHDRVAAIKAELQAAGVEYCYASYVDIHGRPKAKCTPIEKFEKMCAGSELFTVGAMEGMGLSGPQEDECAAVPDLDTGVVLPWDRTRAWFTGHLYYHGEPYPNDSRVILQRMVERAEARGIRVNLGFEPEYYVLRGESGKGLDTITQDYSGVCPAYDIDLTEDAFPYLARMRKYMDELGWNVYSFDQEGGNGQYEFDFGYTDVMSSADQFVFMRLMAKRVAHDFDARASFMPKPFASEFRSGAHFNISLEDIETGENLFAPGENPDSMAQSHGINFSRLAFNFTAGLLRHAGAITALTCPTYNSYQGLLAQGEMADQSWAPVVIAYGRNNRSAMLRMPANRYCTENRAPDMSCNPYLAAALHIAAGLEGIDEDLDPGKPLNDNAYDLGEMPLSRQREALLPRTLLHALEAFDADPLVDDVLGEFKSIYIRQKLGEWESEFYRVGDEHRRRTLWTV